MYYKTAVGSLKVIPERIVFQTTFPVSSISSLPGLGFNPFMCKYVCGWPCTMVVSSRQLRVPFKVVCPDGAVRSRAEMKVIFFFAFEPFVYTFVHTFVVYLCTQCTGN